jgi:tetratricopeptide (TPR) repeat protein
MSVVNDVLKNLDQRKKNTQMAGASPFFYEEEKSSNKWLWLGLMLAMICCSVMASIIYLQYSETNKELLQQLAPISANKVIEELPEDLFIANIKIEKSEVVEGKDLNIVTSNNILSSNKINAIQPESELTAAVPVLLKPLEKKIIKKIPEILIAKRTETSKASESAVSAINSGDMNAARSNLEQASRKVQEEVKLRLLLKENPAEVLLRIKSKHNDYEKNPTLLALAAQGQQRAGLHGSAVELYKALIPLEPEQSKWRAGLAISLESLGDKASAKRLYELALSMNNLPISLRRFSESRLTRLSL